MAAIGDTTASLAHPQADVEQHPLPGFRDPPGAEHTSFAPDGAKARSWSRYRGCATPVRRSPAGSSPRAQALPRQRAAQGAGDRPLRARPVGARCRVALRGGWTRPDVEVDRRPALPRAEGALPGGRGGRRCAPRRRAAVPAPSPPTRPPRQVRAWLPATPPSRFALARRRLRSPLPAGAAKPLVHLLLNRTLRHHPRSQPSQFAHHTRANARRRDRPRAARRSPSQSPPRVPQLVGTRSD